MKNLLLSIVSLFSFTHLFSQTNYYVKPSGSNSNSGTSVSQAWATIQHAASNVSPGSVVNILGGTYKELIQINVSGTAGSPITFKNYQNDTVVISGADVTATASRLIQMQNNSFINIEGLVLDSLFVLDGKGIFVFNTVGNSSSNISMRKLTIRNIGFSSDTSIIPLPTTYANSIAVVGYGNSLTDRVTNITVDSCNIYNNVLGYGENVTLSGNVDTFYITNNFIHNNTNTGIAMAGNYSYASSNPFLNHARNGIVKNNRCFKNFWAQPFPHGNGIHCDGCELTTIEKNICDSNWVGISIASENPGNAKKIKAINNLILNNGDAGMMLGGNDTGGIAFVDSSEIRNNTFKENDFSNLPNTEHGEMDIKRVNSVVIRNNIFKSRNDLLLFTDNTSPQNYISDYNCYYTTSGNQGSAMVNYQWNNTWTYQMYKNQTGKDVHSIFDSPNFVNATIYPPDIRLGFNSPCINAGDSNTVILNSEYDFNGLNRIVNTVIDIGASENQTPLGTTIYNKSFPILYPNPSNGYVYFSYGSCKESDYEVKILDMNNRLLISFIMTNFNKSLDIRSLNAGIYLVDLKEIKSGNRFQYKFFKQ